MRKREKCAMLSGLQPLSALMPRATLLKAAVSGMINRFFNGERCRPFQSNNSLVFQPDWAVDFEMGSDVLCVGTCHFSHSARHLWGSRSWEPSRCNSSWNKALGTKLQLTHWVSYFLHCKWVHSVLLCQTSMGFVLKKAWRAVGPQNRYADTFLCCRMEQLKIHSLL